MLFLTRLTLPAIALAAMLSTAQAQTATGSEHEGHHPEEAAPAAQSQPAPAPGAQWRPDLQAHVWVGRELPPELAAYDPPPYTFERFLEDELNESPRPVPPGRPLVPRATFALIGRRPRSAGPARHSSFRDSAPARAPG